MAGAHIGKIIIGVFWILLGAFIISVLVTPAPSRQEPQNPQQLGLPNEILAMYDSGGLEPEDNSAVVSSDSTIIQFDYIETLDYEWGGENAQVYVTSPVNVTLTAETENFSYSQTIIDKKTSVAPYLWVHLEGNQFVHQWVDGRAVMDVVYAVSLSSNKYTPSTQQIERNFHVYVVTPDAAKVMNDMEAYRSWQEELAVRQTNLPWYLLFCLGFFIVPGALLISYAFKQRTRTKNQYSMHFKY